MNQREMLLKHLQEVGPLTPWKAILDYGITKLSTRISELKSQGYVIYSGNETRTNRFGKKVTHKSYWMTK